MKWCLGILLLLSVSGCLAKGPPSCWENPRHIDCVLGTKQFGYKAS